MISYVLTVLAVMLGIPSMASFQNELAKAVGELSGGQTWTRQQLDWTFGWAFAAACLALVSLVTGRAWWHNRTRWLVLASFLINASALIYWLIAGCVEACHDGLFPWLPTK